MDGTKTTKRLLNKLCEFIVLGREDFSPFNRMKCSTILRTDASEELKAQYEESYCD